MSKALKATKFHEPPRKAQARKRPALTVVKPGHDHAAAASGARTLQSRVAKTMTRTPRLVHRHVDVLAAGGHVVARYRLALEHGCLDAEYEEAALILAEHDGLVEAAGLIARCAD